MEVIKNKMATIKVQIAQHASIKLKFTWNDPCDILSIKKIKWRSQVIKNKMAAIKVQIAQHAPIKLKFTWNDPCDILSI